MTGGRVVILGPTGRNFAAGMSGGIAYVLDRTGDFEGRCNLGMVDLEGLDGEDRQFLRMLIMRHVDHTASSSGQAILHQWDALCGKFVKVMPRDYKRVLMAEARAQSESREPGFAELVGPGVD